MIAKENYVKYNVSVYENIEEVKKLGMVISESVRVLGVVHT